MFQKENGQKKNIDNCLEEEIENVLHIILLLTGLIKVVKRTL